MPSGLRSELVEYTERPGEPPGLSPCADLLRIRVNHWQCGHVCLAAGAAAVLVALRGAHYDSRFAIFGAFWPCVTSFRPSCRTCPACWRTSPACSPRAATTSTSLAVGETEDPDLSRMTFVVVGDDSVLEQVRKQLEKIVTVVRVDDVSSQDYVERDLMLIKVEAPPAAKRSEIRELAEIFRGRIVDVGADEVMVEISGQERKIEAFIDLMRPFGIVELVRTGRIAMVRGSNRASRRREARIRRSRKSHRCSRRLAA